jgi:hypothetical protein
LLYWYNSTNTDAARKAADGETLEAKAKKGRPSAARVKIDSNVQPGYVRLALEKVSVIFKNQEVLKDASWQVLRLLALLVQKYKY